MVLLTLIRCWSAHKLLRRINLEEIVLLYNLFLLVTALTAWLDEAVNSGEMLELLYEVGSVLFNNFNWIRFLVFLQILKDERFDSFVVLERLEDIDHVWELVQSAISEGLPDEAPVVISTLQFSDCLFDHIQSIDEFVFE